MKIKIALGVLLFLGMGCSALRQGTASKQTNGPQQAPISVSDARGILEEAASSADPELRSLSLPFLVETSEGDTWLRRAWLDPSRAVQRAIARSHPLRLSDEQLQRAGADSLAVGLAILGRSELGTVLQWPKQSGVADELVRALGGDDAARLSVLEMVREGMIPSEPLLIELLVRSELEGVGQAMAEGALAAEEEMRLPLALAAHQLAPETGRAALLEVLRDSDEMTRLFAVEALTHQDSEQSVGWLRRAANGDSRVVSDHAKLGLVALGHSKLDVALKGLSSPDRDQRAWAATCLGLASRKRPLPRGAVIALQSTWRDESATVRWATTEALIESVGISGVPFIRSTSESEPDTVSVMMAGKWFELYVESVQ